MERIGILEVSFDILAIIPQEIVELDGADAENLTETLSGYNRCRSYFNFLLAVFSKRGFRMQKSL